MSRHDLKSILRCPLDRSELSAADEELLTRLNARIRAGGVINLGGRRVEKPLDGGYIRAAGDRVYPVVDDIPVLLADEAIAVDEGEIS